MNQIKTNLIQNVVVILLSSVFFLFFMNAALAATFCASSVSQLQSNLTDAAGNGQDDTIQIVQGTYAGNFSYISSETNGLSVKGGYAAGCGTRTVDPANTVLDGTNSDSSLILVSSQAADFLVEGLTLQNGTAGNEKGGGIYALTTDGSVTVRNNILSNNTAYDTGGGAFVNADSVTFEDNTISQNSGGGGPPGGEGTGAGLSVMSASSITLTRNTITDNTAQGHGGGIFLDPFLYDQCTVQLTDNTISNNSTPAAGGGLMAYGGTIVLTSNRFNGNSAGDSAGMWVNAVDLTATGNTFGHNIASNNGGGMDLSVEGLTLINNIIHHNTATIWDGGGVGITNVWTATLANNTIVGNTAGNDGGGVKLWLGNDSASANLYNNIIMDNTAARANDLFIDNDLDNNVIPSPVDLLNNDFDQSAAGFYIHRSIPLDSSNLDNADPGFVDQANADYQLSRSSPCIDAGTSMGAPDTDIVGNSRPQGAGYDIGAYEYVQSASIVQILMLLIGN